MKSYLPKSECKTTRRLPGHTLRWLRRSSIGSRFLLPLTMWVLIAAGLVSAQDAGDLYREGKALLSEGKSVAAFLKLEKAAALKPSAERYAKLRDEARGLALDSAVREAASIPLSSYPKLVELANLCTVVGPGDARTSEVARILDRRRVEAVAVIDAARTLAESAGVDEAERLLDPLKSSAGYFPGFAGVETEIAIRRRMETALVDAAMGRLLDAVNAINSAVALKPDHQAALAVREDIATQVSSTVSSRIAKKVETGRLSDLGGALFTVHEIEKLCPSCTGRLADEPALRARFDEQVSTLLRELKGSGARSTEWGQCAVIAEAAAAWGGGAAPRFKAECDPTAPGFRIALAVEGPEECPRDGLAELIEGALPPGSQLMESTSFRGGVAADVDAAVLIQFSQCISGAAGERNAKSRASSYANGVNRYTNPRYLELQDSLADARRQLDRVKAQQQEDPGDLVYAGLVFAASLSVSSVSNRLRETPAYLEDPILVPYQYEEYEAGAGAALKATVRIFDPGRPSIGLEDPVSEAYLEWAKGFRGVSSTDSTGARDLNPPLPPEADLQKRVFEGFSVQVQEKFAHGLGQFLAARASIALGSKQYADALGYLGVLRVTEISEDDPDLLSLKKEKFSSLLLGPAELETRAASLKVFERRIADRPSPSGGAAGQNASGVLANALKAVVEVRRGDGLGSGFFVSGDGLIVTNHHVIDEPGPIAVSLSDGSEHLAKLVADNADADLAVLRIGASVPHFLELASIGAASVGAEVYAIGSPQGLSGTVTKGIISAKRSRAGVQILQVDVAINPGNSGGPVVLANGTVVGVSTFTLRESEGLNFAVAIDEAFGLISKSKSTGSTN